MSTNAKKKLIHVVTVPNVSINQAHTSVRVQRAIVEIHIVDAHVVKRNV